MARRRDVDFNQSDKDIKAVIDLFWRLTNQDVKNKKNNGLPEGVSFPPSSRAPSRFSHP